MTKEDEIYTPQQNGIEGFASFGDVQHCTNYERKGAVYVGGVRGVGPCYESTLVAEFLAKGNVRPIARVTKAYCSPDAPDTVATSADRRRGWRYETITGLPDDMRGPSKVADGALTFAPGWDFKATYSVSRSLIENDGNLGSDSAGVTSRSVNYGSDE